jgi:CDP-paratose 2-epimerase
MGGAREGVGGDVWRAGGDGCDPDVEERVRVLVTGGLGVVGSRIVRRLLDSGHSVRVWDAMEAPRNRWIAARFGTDFHGNDSAGERIFGLTTGRIEKAEPALAVNLLYGCDAVIHAAASTGIPHSVLNPDDDWRSNVDATRVLLEALRKHPIPTVVLSSVKPYAVPDDIEARGGLREDDVLVPDEPYAASKAAQSMLAMAYARSYDLPVVTFRCSNLASSAPCHGPRHGAWTWLAICAAIGRPLEIQGDGLQSRDVLAGDDVYEACMLALSNARTLAGEVFNLGGGASNRISIVDAVALLKEWQPSAEVRHAPARAMDDKHVFASYAKFNRATDWRPRVEVRVLLRQIFEWACANRDELRQLYEGM